MLIKYEFADGQATQVEVDDCLGGVILQIEKETFNSDRRETRRHESLVDRNDKDERLVDITVDIETEVARRMEAEALHLAISKLKPDERELIQRLYLDKHPMTQAEYAKKHGMSEAALWKRAERTRKKLKTLLTK